MIPDELRAELDQTPAWWDVQYRRLVGETFTPAPFNPDEHEGHELIEVRTYAATEPLVVHCTACPTVLIPKGRTT